MTCLALRRLKSTYQRHARSALPPRRLAQCRELAMPTMRRYRAFCVRQKRQARNAP